MRTSYTNTSFRKLLSQHTMNKHTKKEWNLHGRRRRRGNLDSWAKAQSSSSCKCFRKQIIGFSCFRKTKLWRIYRRRRNVKCDINLCIHTICLMIIISCYMRQARAPLTHTNRLALPDYGLRLHLFRFLSFFQLLFVLHCGMMIIFQHSAVLGCELCFHVRFNPIT